LQAELGDIAKRLKRGIGHRKTKGRKA
jgi:hypothetical protein